MYPRLKRAERYPLNGAVAGRWRDALTLLESGFPRSRTELEKSFKIVSMKRDGNYAEFTMAPKSAETRRLLAEVRIGFDVQELLLRATELRFSDESSMRNEFEQIETNP